MNPNRRSTAPRCVTRNPADYRATSPATAIGCWCSVFAITTTANTCSYINGCCTTTCLTDDDDINLPSRNGVRACGIASPTAVSTFVRHIRCITSTSTSTEQMERCRCHAARHRPRLIGTGVIESCIRCNACVNIFNYHTSVSPDRICDGRVSRASNSYP